MEISEENYFVKKEKKDEKDQNYFITIAIT